MKLPGMKSVNISLPHNDAVDNFKWTFDTRVQGRKIKHLIQRLWKNIRAFKLIVNSMAETPYQY